MSDQVRCGRCGERDLNNFGTRIVSGARYRRSHCRKCENLKRTIHRQKNGCYTSKEARRRGLDRLKQMRKKGINIAWFIVRDSKSSDGKRGTKNDIDEMFVKNIIKRGCSYCGEEKLRMTLDRVDNDKGHTRDNVVPACVRCNYARGNMPYAAWLCLARGMKKARLANLFGNWIGRLNRGYKG